MPKCLMCGSDIDRLKVYTEGVMEYDESGYSGVLEPLDCADDEFECPQCGNVLFTDEAEARAFMKGKYDIKI